MNMRNARCVSFFRWTAGILLGSLNLCPPYVSASPASQLVQNSVSSGQIKLSVKVGLIVFPPLIQQDNEGRCTGSAVDTIYRTFPASDYNIELYCATPARVYRDFEDGKIDITINVKSTVSLVDTVYFSENPIDVLEVVLYAKDLDTTSSVSAIHLFNYHGMREQLLLENYQIFDQPNGKEAITTFIRGGTDAVLSYRGPFEYYVEQILDRSAFAREHLTFEEKSLLKVPTYFVVNKSSIYSKQFIDQIDAKN
ncbi:hypothetical protein [Glaciecola sp. SC05]|uniref:hypothetical protein n=1 Tax=Glaciecola sp. SC05 TaxID=1987355 RepID=UPI0035288D4F